MVSGEDGAPALELRVSGCKIRSPVKAMGSPGTIQVHMGEGLRLDVDLAFPADDVPGEMEVSLTGGAGFRPEDDGPYTIEQLPEAPGDSPLRAALEAADVGPEGEDKADDGLVYRRLTLSLAPSDLPVGPFTLGGEVLHKDYGTSLDTLPDITIDVLPPRLVVSNQELEELSGDEGAGYLLSAELSTSAEGKVKGDLGCVLVPTGMEPDAKGAAVADLGTMKVSVRDTLVVEWEVGRDEIKGGGSLDAILTLATKKTGTLRATLSGIMDIRQDVDCRAGAPSVDSPSPAPGDGVTVTVPLDNRGRGEVEVTPTLHILSRPAVEEGAGENGGKAGAAALADLTGEPVKLATGEGGAVNLTWTVPSDLGHEHEPPVPVEVLVAVDLSYVSANGARGEWSGNPHPLFRTAPGSLPVITGLSSGRDRVVPGETFPVSVTVADNGDGGGAEVQLALRAWLVTGVGGQDASLAVPPQSRPVYRTHKKLKLSRRPQAIEFGIPVPESGDKAVGEGPDAVLPASLRDGGPMDLAVEAVITSADGAPVSRYIPSVASVIGKSVVGLEAARLRGAVVGGKGKGAEALENLPQYLFPDEKVMMTETHGHLTQHRLNSNTFIYEYKGEVVDSIEWRARGRPLLPFYKSLFMNVLHGGKYTNERLDVLVRALDNRGMLAAGLCHRILYPAKDVPTVGGVVWSGEKKAAGPRKDLAPARWKEWALGIPVRPGKGGPEGGKEAPGSVKGLARALGIRDGTLAKGAPALNFILESAEEECASDRSGGKSGKKASGKNRRVSGTGGQRGAGPKAPVERMERLETLFDAARRGVRAARLTPLRRLFTGLSALTREDASPTDTSLSPIDDIARRQTLKGADAIRAAGLATCLKTAIMARSAMDLKGLRDGTREPSTAFLEMLRAEVNIFILDTLTERLLESGGEHGRDLAPHGLLCGLSAFHTLRRDSRLVFGEFLRRARRYVSNMRLRNTLAAVRGPVSVRPEDDEIEYIAGSEVRTSMAMENPTGEPLTVRPALALPERGFSIVEPEAAFSDGLHFLPAMEIPAGKERTLHLTMFIPAGEEAGDSRAVLTLAPAGDELLPELGGAGAMEGEDARSGTGNGQE